MSNSTEEKLPGKDLLLLRTLMRCFELAAHHWGSPGRDRLIEDIRTLIEKYNKD